MSPYKSISTSIFNPKSLYALLITALSLVFYQCHEREIIQPNAAPISYDNSSPVRNSPNLSTNIGTNNGNNTNINTQSSNVLQLRLLVLENYRREHENSYRSTQFTPQAGNFALLSYDMSRLKLQNDSIIKALRRLESYNLRNTDTTTPTKTATTTATPTTVGTTGSLKPHPNNTRIIRKKQP